MVSEALTGVLNLYLIIMASGRGREQQSVRGQPAGDGSLLHSGCQACLPGDLPPGLPVLTVGKCEMLVWRGEVNGLNQLPRNDILLSNPAGDYFCCLSIQSSNLLHCPE